MCKKTRLNIYLSEDLKGRIQAESEKLSISQNSYIIMAINEYLKQADGIVALSQVMAKLDNLKVEAE
ncbi:MAG: hypothetical protein IJX17_06255 [Clostridia bacterium]|nr:hypothetical protein [Clostridia bacterium]